jgi:hypothetical protein
MTQAITSKEAIAKHVCERLYREGCRLASVSLDFATPMIVVDTPSAALISKRYDATEIKEVFGNQMRKAWVANMNGCRVVWRSQPLRKM